MNSRLLLPILFFLISVVASWAQTTVTGIVRDASNNNAPLIGVTIQEKDSDRGTITDIDGRFSLNVSSPDPVLIFRYTGYATLEVKLDGRNQVEVSLSEE